MLKTFVIKLVKEGLDPETQDSLLQYLPMESQLRLRDRPKNNSRLQTVCGELLARYSVGKFVGNASQEIKLVFGEKGKPHIDNLPEVHFNISHSGHYVVCAVAASEVGIDVERVRKVNLRIAERFFSAPELNDLMALDEESRKQYFITLWTIKESYLKAIGRGLTQHLNSFTIVRDGSNYKLTGNEEAENFGIKTQQLDAEYSMAVCAPLPLPECETHFISLEEILQVFSKTSFPN
jgi:4'-phosphopantetheinyl transferase